MQIQFIGHTSFILKSKDAVVVTDPFSKEVETVSFPKMVADFVSKSCELIPFCEGEKFGTDETFVLAGPGEYEVKGVMIRGFANNIFDENNKLVLKNTIYQFEVDGVNITHLGLLSSQLDEALIKSLEDTDILLLPVGEKDCLKVPDMVKVVKQLDPSIVIPMLYHQEQHTENFADLSPIEKFLTEISLEPERLDKLVAIDGELPEEMQIVVLQPKV